MLLLAYHYQYQMLSIVNILLQHKLYQLYILFYGNLHYFYQFKIVYSIGFIDYFIIHIYIGYINIIINIKIQQHLLHNLHILCKVLLVVLFHCLLALKYLVIILVFMLLLSGYSLHSESYKVIYFYNLGYQFS